MLKTSLSSQAKKKKNRAQAGFGLLGQSLLIPAQDSETII